MQLACDGHSHQRFMTDPLHQRATKIFLLFTMQLLSLLRRQWRNDFLVQLNRLYDVSWVTFIRKALRYSYANKFVLFTLQLLNYANKFVKICIGTESSNSYEEMCLNFDWLNCIFLYIWILILGCLQAPKLDFFYYMAAYVTGISLWSIFILFFIPEFVYFQHLYITRKIIVSSNTKQ